MLGNYQRDIQTTFFYGAYKCIYWHIRAYTGIYVHIRAYTGIYVDIRGYMEHIGSIYGDNFAYAEHMLGICGAYTEYMSYYVSPIQYEIKSVEFASISFSNSAGMLASVKFVNKISQIQRLSKASAGALSLSLLCCLLLVSVAAELRSSDGLSFSFEAFLVDFLQCPQDHEKIRAGFKTNLIPNE